MQPVVPQILGIRAPSGAGERSNSGRRRAQQRGRSHSKIRASLPESFKSLETFCGANQIPLPSAREQSNAERLFLTMQSPSSLWMKWLRRGLGLYPIEIGKGWVAKVYPTSKIPEGETLEVPGNIRFRLHPDYVFLHLYLFGEFEPSNTAAFRRIVRPGDVCLDAGANFGFYSCSFAKWGARVFSFEPVPSTYRLLQENVQLNAMESSVRVFNSALGDQPGSIRIFTFRELSHGHASSSDLGRADAIPVDCPIDTIDAVCDREKLDRVDFVKIDVEGYEFEVLKGGAGLLSRPQAPVIHFEVNAECTRHRNRDPNSIVDLLKSHGYTEFLQIKRYGGVRRAPALLPISNFDYLAFKDRDRAERVLNSRL